MLNFYFTGVTRDMYATVSYTNHSGEEKSYRVETADFFRNNNAYQARVNDLAIADGNTLVTCTVYKADGSVYAQATDTMNSYVARALNAGEKYQWMESIAKFSASAYNYLRNR